MRRTTGSIKAVQMKLLRLSGKKRRFRILAAVLCLALIAGISWTLFHPAGTDAAWYDDSYSFRIKETIGNTGAATGNQKVKFDIDTATLITAGKMQSDCDDTRFTDINGKSLKYFLDSAGGACNTASTDYYVFVPTINAGNTVIYVYYGNPTATSGSQSSQFSQSTFSPTSGPTAATEEQGRAPVLYWKFDEGSGATAQDSTKNNNDGTITGAARKTDDLCKAGKCLSLDGTDDVISRADDSDVDFAAADNFTIQGWFKHGEQTTGQDIITAKQDVGAGGNGPTKIDDPGDPGAQEGSGRRVVRTSTGTLYSILNDGGSCEVWKSATGSTWTEQDSANNPSCNSFMSVAVAVDSTDVLHITYSSGTDFKYVTFSTSTDTFGGAEIIASTSDSTYDMAIAVDSNNKPHVIFSAGDQFDGFACGEDINYGNKVIGSSWTTISLDTALTGGQSSCHNFHGASIAISEDNIPELTYISNTTGLIAKVGNQNNPASFSTKTVDASVSSTSLESSIVIDSSGNTWIGYSDGTTNYATLVKHNDADAWATWQTAVTNSNVGNEPSVAANGSDIYILYTDENADIKYDRYNGSTWLGETNLATGTYENVQVRWSYLNNASYSTYGIDYLYNDFTDLYWNSISISGGGGGSGTDGTGYKVVMEADGDITFGIDDDVSAFPEDFVTSTSANYDDNKWHMVTAVKTGTTNIKLYIDGILIGSDASISSTGTLANSGSLYVGLDRDGTSNAFAGFLDEYKIYRYARSEAQIKADFSGRSTVAGTSGVFGQDPNTTLSNGLVGYWKLDENTGTSTTDSSGNGFTGTLTNSPTWSATGKFGSAVSFDGAGTTNSDVIKVGDQAALELQTFTISAWISRSGTCFFSICPIFAKGMSGFTGYALEVKDVGSGVYKATVSLNDTTQQVSGATTLSTGTWYHLAASVNGSKIKLYVNGALDAEADQTATPAFGSEEATIGNGNSNLDLTFNGKIDDVRVYNRELNATEISALYDWAPSPVLYLPLDEKTGTSTVTDISGSGYTATMNSFSSDDWRTGKYGGALNFDATNNYISVADNTVLDMPNNAVTLEAWIKPHGLTGLDNGIIIKPGQYELRFNSAGKPAAKVLGGTSCGGGGATGVTATTASTLDTWYHVAWTYDGSTNKLYINGALDTSSSETCTIPNTTNALEIGRQSNYFNGSFDEIKVYNYVRTAKQIVADMNGGHPNVGSPVGSALGYWKFDEGTGTTVNNSGSAGSTLNLTFGASTATPSWSNSGKFNKAVNYDGTNDHTYITDNAMLEPGTNDFSVSGWFKLNQLPSTLAHDAKVVFKAHNSDPWEGYEVYIDTDDKAKFTFASAASTWHTASDTQTVSLNTWYHFAATKVGTLTKLYINGKLVGSNTASSSNVFNSDASFLVGAAGSEALDGLIDEVRYYNFALNDTEVTSDYNQGKAAVLGATSTASDGVTVSNAADRSYCIPGDTSACSAPVGEWNFDEGSGTSAFDTSGNNNTGTLTNSPTRVRGKIGKALDLAQSGSKYVLIPDNNAIDNSGAMSIEAWIKPTSTDFDGTFADYVAKSDGTGGSVAYAASVLSSSVLSFYWAAANNFEEYRTSGTTFLTAGQWAHVVLTRNSALNSATAYINGIKYTMTLNGATDTAPGGQTDDLAIGRTGNANRQYFDGEIDQVKIYDYERSQAQVAWSYNRGGPLAWWKFDECSGTTANDSSGNTLNGTITIATGTQTSTGTCNSGTGSEAWSNGTTGKYNSALSIDGNGDYVTVSDNAKLDITGDFTLSAWVNRSSNGSTYLISKTNESTTGGYALLAGNGGEVYCRTNNGTSNTDSTSVTGLVSSGTGWHHVVAVRSGTSCKVYVDGNDRTSSTNTHTTLTANALDLKIGARPDNTQMLTGLIDDARVYNYALTAIQIKTLYNENFTTRFGPLTGSP